MHRSEGSVSGHFRSQMRVAALKDAGYGRRWAVESSMSGLSRTTGAALSARQEKRLFVEAGMQVLA